MIHHHVCPRDWAGDTVFIVASGPSSELVDIKKLRGKRVIAVAHGYRVVPWAQVLVVGGKAFYKSNDLSNFHGQLIVAAQEMSLFYHRDPRLKYMHREGPYGLSSDPGSLCGSESSVMLAINYAVHRGAAQIVLLGCDGKPGADGRRRAASSRQDSRGAIERYQAQERAMETQIGPLSSLGVKIYNCSPGTALKIYPVADIDQFC